MVTEVHEPTTVAQIVEIASARSRLFITGLDLHQGYRCEDPDGERLSTKALNRILRIEPADQICEVEAGLSVEALQIELGKRGQCLPWLPFEPVDASIGGAISLNLPHRLQSQCGSWQDWILGIQIVLPGGSLAKAGTSAVKNVAGFDFQRFIAGTRGSLGVIATVILRTYPIRALPAAHCKGLDEAPESLIYQRVLRSQAEALPFYKNAPFDAASATLCLPNTNLDALKRFPGDWIIGKGFGPKNLEPLEKDQEIFWKKIKKMIDPELQFGRNQFPLRFPL